MSKPGSHSLDFGEPAQGERRDVSGIPTLQTGSLHADLNTMWINVLGFFF